MTHDVYAHPPRRPLPEEVGITRRSLLRLGLTEAARDDVDFVEVSRRLRAGWERDGNGALLRSIEPVAEVIAGLAGPAPGSEVLDVGAGDGNLALACAERGAAVTACDIASTMVERGRRRSGAAVRWVQADAEDLPFPDQSFDAVLSAFGAALAARPMRTVRELCRVARPGATVIVCAWVPRGLPGRLYELAEEIEPFPQAVPSPSEWGREAIARKRLGRALEGVEVRVRTVRLRFADHDTAFDALAGWVALDPARLPSLRPGFGRLLASSNNSATAVELDARYLIARGRRPE